MAKSTLKIQGARFILTLDSERRIIQDSSLVIEGQRIARVGKASELADVPADRVIDATEMVVTPGFVNAHHHASYTHATRGGFFADELGSTYMPSVFALEAAASEEDEYHSALLCAVEMLKYGTTCFLDPGDIRHLDACLQAYQEAGCRVIVGSHVVDRPNPMGFPTQPTDQAIAALEQTIRSYDRRLDGRVRAWVMLFSTATCTEELLIAAKRLADQYEVGLTFHQSPRQTSVEQSLQEHGKRPLEYLDSINVLGPSVLLAHVVAVDESEVAALTRTGTKVVMIPTTALRMGLGMTSRGLFPEMLAKGICVALGTDSPDFGLVEVLRPMYLAATLFKDSRQDAAMVPAETALEMATIQGARALGLEREIGSIEIGKKADLVLFDTKRPEWRPLLNPVNNLVYNADGRSVHTVLVDGRIVVERHKLASLDEWTLIQKVQELGEGMLARTGLTSPSHWPVT